MKWCIRWNAARKGNGRVGMECVEVCCRGGRGVMEGTSERKFFWISRSLGYTSSFNYCLLILFFSVSLFFNRSWLPPPPPFHQQWLDQHVSFVRVMRFLIIEDGASRSCRAPQTSKWPQGRTDMVEPDMRKNTGLHILALGCTCNTCFPCCFIHCFLDLAKYFF